MRNVRNYDVFKLADRLALQLYRATARFPKEETYGLASQMRRAALSIPLNLVEGAARTSGRDFAHFVDIAAGSCEEVRYQVHVAEELGYMKPDDCRRMDREYENVMKMLNRLRGMVRGAGSRSAVAGRTANSEQREASEE